MSLHTEKTLLMIMMVMLVVVLVAGDDGHDHVGDKEDKEDEDEDAEVQKEDLAKCFDDITICKCIYDSMTLETIA